MRKKVEILAPAGSFESMKAAVAAGADAVYMGGSRFGARAYADNPEEDQLLEAIDYLHLHGGQLYMTVNTLVKEREMESLYPYLKPYYEQGLDAAIVQDMGVFSLIREQFPDLPIHASTQMTVTGPLGAGLMTRMGASRIVTARELTLEEIRRIYDETGAEIESFVHGALCYSYSGQCLFSSLIGGRSGNRGRCAQTCRLPFEVKQGLKTLNKKDDRYVLSLKDLCTLDILPDILEAGVYSLKIEGRMKSPRYTAGVVSIYRKYVDRYLRQGRDGYHVEPADRKLLLDLFDRGGQTDGYYQTRNGREMIVMKEKPAFREENRELYRYLDQTYVEAEQKEPVSGLAAVREGEPLSLSLSYEDRLNGNELRTAFVCGNPVQTAKNQAADEARIAKQLQKTGGTPFYFKELKIELSGQPFVPVQELNELRRNTFAQLNQAIFAPYRRTALPEQMPGAKGKPERDAAGAVEAEDSRISVSLESPELLETVLEFPQVDSIYLDSTGFDASEWKRCVERCLKAGKQCLLVLPHIFRDMAYRYFEQQREAFLDAGFSGVVVRAWEEIEWLRQWAPQLPVVVDFGLYTMNRRAEDWIVRMMPERPLRFTLPVELNSRELSERGCSGAELLVYGRLPMMVTAQCVKKTVDGCTKCPEVLSLRDRKGKEFPVKNHCRFCYDTIYNADPLSLLGERHLIGRLKPSYLRLSFTTETKAEARTVLHAFCDYFLCGEEAALSGNYTRGHFKRGIE